jgi:sugar diacid utilization regulator
VIPDSIASDVHLLTTLAVTAASTFIAANGAVKKHFGDVHRHIRTLQVRLAAIEERLGIKPDDVTQIVNGRQDEK